MNTLRLLSSVALLSTASFANAAIVNGYGVSTGASTSGNCPSYCTSPFSFSGSDGGEFDTNAYSEENTYGNARAQAVLDGTDSTAVLKVQASSAQGQGAFASAFAVQGYNYTGTGSSTYELDLNLHGSVTDGTNGYNNNNLQLSFAILKGEDLAWNPDFATLVYEEAYFAGLENLVTTSLYINSGFDVNESTTISFDVAAGESFYIVSALGAIAKNGEVDGWNTFTMNFDDATGLEAVTSAAPVAVPEASSLGLFSLSLLSLIAVRRKQA